MNATWPTGLNSISHQRIGAMPELFGYILITIIAIIAILLLLSLIATMVEGIRNLFSPVLSHSAIVTAKRMHISGTHTYTWYYVTFELSSGERYEFNTSGRQYGSLVEGDVGTLFVRGTRYIDFVR
jgi:Protein of unknown function (DUF2500)